MTNSVNNDINPKSVFEYDDYRQFLKDYFNQQKKLRASFSHRFFAQRAGLSSPSFYLDVVKGKFNLTMKTLPRMIKGLKLQGKAARFFENLVWFNQTKDTSEREKYFQKIVALRKSSKLFRLNKKHYSYFNHYYYAIIRELAVFSDWNNDIKKLASMLNPPISPHEAQNALDCLLDLGLLIKTKRGKYEQQQAGITTSQIPVSILKAARRDFIELSKRASDTMGPDKRYIAHTTLSMSKKSLKKATQIMDEARAKIVELALNDDKVEQVQELIFQLFPVSSEIGKGDSSHE